MTFRAYCIYLHARLTTALGSPDAARAWMCTPARAEYIARSFGAFTCSVESWADVLCNDATVGDRPGRTTPAALR